MKHCPRCSQTYLDDTLSFCLNDGSPLVNLPLADEVPTLVRHHPPGERTDPTTQTGQPIFAKPPAEVPRSRTGGSGLLKILAGALGAVLLLLVGAGITYLVMLRPGIKESNIANSNVTVASNGAALPGSSPGPSSKPGAPPSNAATPITPNREPKNTPNSPAPPSTTEEVPRTPISAVDPGTERLQFRRGSVSERFQGVVVRQRSFVLRTLSGQWMSATVRSANGCVVFSDGTGSIGYSTSPGDNYLRIRNTCGEPARYTMNVTIR